MSSNIIKPTKEQVLNLFNGSLQPPSYQLANYLCNLEYGTTPFAVGDPIPWWFGHVVEKHKEFLLKWFT